MSPHFLHHAAWVHLCLQMFEIQLGGVQRVPRGNKSMSDNMAQFNDIMNELVACLELAGCFPGQPMASQVQVQTCRIDVGLPVQAKYVCTMAPTMHTCHAARQ